MSPIDFLMNEQDPFRTALKRIIAKLGLGSFALRYRIGALERMHYAHALFEGAKLAVALGHRRISAIEFGVAGGTGLRLMEVYAAAIEQLLPIEIDIYGFDTGGGLPAPVDHRDLPYHWQEGFFAMDQDRLRSTLRRAKLILGNVAETHKTFIRDYSPAPIAAIAHDMDFYSSTREALKLFDVEPQYLLPRIFNYFDDTIGSSLELYSDFTGQRLAIEEFNETHSERKIAVPHYLRTQDGLGRWRHQIWITHLFDHPLYNRFVSKDDQQLPLA